MSPEDEGTGNDQGVPDLDDILAQAEDLTSEQRYSEAQAMLRDAAARFPESPLPHHALSVVYLEQLRQDHEHEELWETLTEDEGLFDEAVSEAELACEIDDGFTPARNNLGRLFAYRGWWAEAIRQWEISLTLYPDQPAVRDDMSRVRELVS